MSVRVRGWLLVPLLAVLPLGLGLGLYLLLQPEPTPADQVREAIQSVADGAGAQDLGMMLAPISRAYSDDDGLNFDAIRGLLFREVQRRDNISVLLGPIEVALEPSGDRASAAVDVALAEGVDPSALSFFPSDADALHFELELQREDDAWMIVSQRHEPIR